MTELPDCPDYGPLSYAFSHDLLILWKYAAWIVYIEFKILPVNQAAWLVVLMH